MNGRHRHDPKGHITVETKSSRLFRLCRMAQPVIFAVLTLAPVCASRSPATAQTQAKPQHRRHLGRRYRLLERQRVQPRHDGLSDAQH